MLKWMFLLDNAYCIKLSWSSRLTILNQLVMNRKSQNLQLVFENNSIIRNNMLVMTMFSFRPFSRNWFECWVVVRCIIDLVYKCDTTIYNHRWSALLNHPHNNRMLTNFRCNNCIRSHYPPIPYMSIHCKRVYNHVARHLCILHSWYHLRCRRCNKTRRPFRRAATETYLSPWNTFVSPRVVLQ